CARERIAAGVDFW
nr:immunoglobulin heavy chain junction region [Macaca mulatta]MOV47888.1 immunoglobulin heavy chain junction region [Macaca mulatta]MOV48406.1 immunoglobulin heavy chain junction region [Macaca mulatta]MOV52143.1 immunoglobulin heavy chain junction region [Macaca mulatta]